MIEESIGFEKIRPIWNGVGLILLWVRCLGCGFSVIVRTLNRKPVENKCPSCGLKWGTVLRAEEA